MNITQEEALLLLEVPLAYWKLLLDRILSKGLATWLFPADMESLTLPSYCPRMDPLAAQHLVEKPHSALRTETCEHQSLLVIL